MSQTFEIVCHKCKRTLWIGQRPAGVSVKEGIIYNTPKHHAQLRGFLYSHIGHHLEFIDSDNADYFDEYEDMTDYGHDEPLHAS